MRAVFAFIILGVLLMSAAIALVLMLYMLGIIGN
jgi:hypothetical protein